jgi:hypothetical protein
MVKKFYATFNLFVGSLIVAEEEKVENVIDKLIKISLLISIFAG